MTPHEHIAEVRRLVDGLQESVVHRRNAQSRGEGTAEMYEDVLRWRALISDLAPALADDLERALAERDAARAVSEQHVETAREECRVRDEFAKRDPARAPDGLTLVDTLCDEMPGYEPDCRKAAETIAGLVSSWLREAHDRGVANAQIEIPHDLIARKEMENDRLTRERDAAREALRAVPVAHAPECNVWVMCPTMGGHYDPPPQYEVDPHRECTCHVALVRRVLEGT